ncbi:hypothetical protein WJX81_006179 [Elliptochloris bilobata]|uniref:Saposin B-type domain-containing protein n=1 Tax=Elliptochloris bilobata TaxID=381761 RepID=A0AAW1S0B0_9CHLO
MCKYLAGRVARAASFKQACVDLPVELQAQCEDLAARDASILGNLEMQKQILEYAKQMCTSLSTFHDQCLAYVELYGPLVFNMLVQYLTPELCVTLSYCPPVTAGPGSVMYAS